MASPMSCSSSSSSSTVFLEAEKQVGEGFRPTDHELVNHFLRLIILGDHQRVRRIPEVDIYKYEPWELPYYSGLSLSDSEWYFFHRHNLRKGGRAKRKTKAGHWKSTGRPRKVEHEVTRKAIGVKKSLVFQGRTPSSVGTNWIIHEYCANLNLPDQGAVVLCKLMKRSKRKAKNRPDDGRDQPEVAALHGGPQNPEGVTDQCVASEEGIGCVVSDPGECGRVSQMGFDVQNQSSDLKVDETTSGEGGTGGLVSAEPEIYAGVLEEFDAETLWNLWSSCGFKELNHTSSSTTESNVHGQFDNGLEAPITSTNEGAPSSPMDFTPKYDYCQEADRLTTDGSGRSPKP